MCLGVTNKAQKDLAHSLFMSRSDAYLDDVLAQIAPLEVHARATRFCRCRTAPIILNTCIG